MPQIYSRRAGAVTPPSDAVYVGRPSPFENPFKLSPLELKGTTLSKFREYAEKRLLDEPNWLEPLRGKDLVCWCKPKPDSLIPCHAEILMELLYKKEKPEQGQLF